MRIGSAFVTVAVAIGLCSVARGQGQISMPSAARSSGGSSYSSSPTASAFGSRSLGNTLTPGKSNFMGSSGGLGGDLMQQLNSSAGQLNSSASYMTHTPGQFVGASSANISNFLSALGTNARYQQQFQNMQRAQQRPLTQPNMMNQGQNVSPMRTKVSLGFERPATLGDDSLAVTLSKRFEAVPRFTTQGSVQVAVKDRTAILLGVVASSHDRLLAEGLARLEPGISQVENRLVVQSPSSSSSPAATPAPAVVPPPPAADGKP